MLYSQPFNPQSDIDLEGINFVDLPWMLRDPLDMPPYLQGLQQQFRAAPNMNLTLSRLYALGVDAYNLMRFLRLPNQFPATGLFGASGNLFFDKYQHIYRQMDWGMFGASAVQLKK
jgi:outer membrane PBP1 activator LpoA protein